MSFLPVLVTVEPASEPVTLAEAKAQCRVTEDSEDALLSGYIVAARKLVEEYTGTKLVSQTVAIRCSSFYDLCRLPAAPLSAVADVKYLDSAGTEQTLSTDVYEAILVGLEPAIRTKYNQSWPSARAVSDAVRVTAAAGYSTVPEPVKQAMLLLIGHWHANREAVTVGGTVAEMPFAAEALLVNYRR